jgi:hypothetical protein
MFCYIIFLVTLEVFCVICDPVSKENIKIALLPLSTHLFSFTGESTVLCEVIQNSGSYA